MCFLCQLHNANGKAITLAVSMVTLGMCRGGGGIKEGQEEEGEDKHKVHYNQHQTSKR